MGHTGSLEGGGHVGGLLVGDIGVGGAVQEQRWWVCGGHVADRAVGVEGFVVLVGIKAGDLLGPEAVLARPAVEGAAQAGAIGDGGITGTADEGARFALVDGWE